MKKESLLFPLAMVLFVFIGTAIADTPAVPVEAAQIFDDSEANPRLCCSRLDFNRSLELAMAGGAKAPCSLYVAGAEASSPDEQTICSIAANPTDTLKIKSLQWYYEPPDVAAENVIQFSGATETPATSIALIVCQDGTYSIAGPMIANQDAPCDICFPRAAVPTVSHWGMLLLAVLLTGSGLWFIRTHQKGGA